MPKNDPIWPEIGIFVHFGPGLAGSFGWWLWHAGCISQDTYLLYLYFLLCWIWQSCGLTCYVSFVSRPFCFKCHSHLRHLLWGVEGRWEKLEKNFTLVFHLKSDWKWNLLFRSSSCASSLSQVEKKTKK